MMKSLKDEIAALEPWYQTIEVAENVFTPGKTPKENPLFEEIRKYVPRNLHGVRVLDLGCNAGKMSIEFAKRGAEVVGVELSKHYYDQAQWIKKKLKLNNITYLNQSVYKLYNMDQKFDVVLALGIFYHLRYPQLFVDICANLCRGQFFINSPVVLTDAEIMEARISREMAGDSSNIILQREEAQFNWWFPSPSGLKRVLSNAGFYDFVEIWRKNTKFVSSHKKERNESAFPTGQIFLAARCDGVKNLFRF